MGCGIHRAVTVQSLHGVAIATAAITAAAPAQPSTPARPPASAHPSAATHPPASASPPVAAPSADRLYARHYSRRGGKISTESWQLVLPMLLLMLLPFASVSAAKEYSQTSQPQTQTPQRHGTPRLLSQLLIESSQREHQRHQPQQERQRQPRQQQELPQLQLQEQQQQQQQQELPQEQLQQQLKLHQQWLQMQQSQRQRHERRRQQQQQNHEEEETWRQLQAEEERQPLQRRQRQQEEQRPQRKQSSQKQERKQTRQQQPEQQRRHELQRQNATHGQREKHEQEKEQRQREEQQRELEAAAAAAVEEDLQQQKYKQEQAELQRALLEHRRQQKQLGQQRPLAQSSEQRPKQQQGKRLGNRKSKATNLEHRVRHQHQQQHEDPQPGSQHRHRQKQQQNEQFSHSSPSGRHAAAPDGEGYESAGVAAERTTAAPLGGGEYAVAVDNFKGKPNIVDRRESRTTARTPERTGSSLKRYESVRTPSTSSGDDVTVVSLSHVTGSAADRLGSVDGRFKGGMDSGAASEEAVEDDVRIKRRYKLYSRCSQHYVRLAGRHLDALAMPDDIYSDLEVVTESFDSQLRVQSASTHEFLCFNRHGRLTVKHSGSDQRCVFRELHPANHYSEFQSAYNNSWYIGFDRNGRKLTGLRRKPDYYHDGTRSTSPADAVAANDATPGEERSKAEEGKDDAAEETRPERHPAAHALTGRSRHAKPTVASGDVSPKEVDVKNRHVNTRRRIARNVSPVPDPRQSPGFLAPVLGGEAGTTTAGRTMQSRSNADKCYQFVKTNFDVTASEGGFAAPVVDASEVVAGGVRVTDFQEGGARGVGERRRREPPATDFMGNDHRVKSQRRQTLQKGERNRGLT